LVCHCRYSSLADSVFGLVVRRARGLVSAADDAFASASAVDAASPDALVRLGRAGDGAFSEASAALAFGAARSRERRGAGAVSALASSVALDSAFAARRRAGF